MTQRNILITGADGYVGRKLALNLLNNNDSVNLTLWMRANSEEERKAKSEKMDSDFSKFSDRISYSFGNLTDEKPFKEITPETITDVVHSAAVIRFNVEEDLAQDVNFLGTKKTLEFAASCPSLDNFTYVSTVYSSGQVSGAISETHFEDDREFVNFYESSKCASEKLVRDSGLNYKIARLSTVIADNNEGDVLQYNVFHNTLRLLYNGLISLLPGDPNTPLYFITGDFAAQSLADIVSAQNSDSKIFHICHEEQESATLQDLMNWVFETFDEYEAFKTKRVMKPLFANEETFNTMASAMKSFSQGILSDALGSITPFAKQLYISKSFSNENLRDVMPNYEAPNPEELIKNATRFLIDNKWGRK